MRTRPMPVLPRRILKVAFAAASLTALWFALVEQAPVDELRLLPVRGDHLVHALTFACLTTLALLLWAPAWLIGAILVAAGGVLEGLQWPVGRDAELSDWIASSVGVGMGAMLFLAVLALGALWRDTVRIGAGKGQAEE